MWHVKVWAAKLWISWQSWHLAKEAVHNVKKWDWILQSTFEFLSIFDLASLSPAVFSLPGFCKKTAEKTAERASKRAADKAVLNDSSMILELKCMKSRA